MTFAPEREDLRRDLGRRLVRRREEDDVGPAGGEAPRARTARRRGPSPPPSDGCRRANGTGCASFLPEEKTDAISTRAGAARGSRRARRRSSRSRRRRRRAPRTRSRPPPPGAAGRRSRARGGAPARARRRPRASRGRSCRRRRSTRPPLRAPASSMARATWCAAAGGVLRTTSVPAAATSSTHSRSARSSFSRGAGVPLGVRHGAGFARHDVARRRLREAEVLQVPRERRLRDVDAPPREALLQLLLRVHGAVPDDPQDLVAAPQGGAGRMTIHEREYSFILGRVSTDFFR